MTGVEKTWIRLAIIRRWAVFPVIFFLLSTALLASPVRAEWIDRSSGTTEHLRGGWVAPDDALFTVGDGGKIIRCDASACTSMTSGTTTPLYDVWGAADNNAAAAGLDTVVWYDGTTWSSITPYTGGITFAPVWISPNGISIFVADTGGTWNMMNRYDTSQSQWNDFSYITTSQVLAFGGYDNDVTFVLATGAVKHTDNSWNVTDIHTPSVSLNLQAAWITPGSRSEAFAADTSSTIYRFDGSSWVDTNAGIPATTDIWGISGSSAADVYAVGKNASSQGVVYHYNGFEWIQEDIPSVSGLIDVAIGSIWCVGEVGDILAWISQGGSLRAPCVRYVSSGSFHSLAIAQDGTLWAWGQNNSGQLGDATQTDKNSPVKIGTDNDWLTVAAGGYHTVAIRNDGTLWTWGDNFRGQLGDGTQDDKNTPTWIGTDTDWQTVAAGFNHNVAIKEDGTLWAWGDNRSGQLGDGTQVSRNKPTQIGTDSDWAMIAAGARYTVAIKQDGSLWAWGNNEQGQLGDGTQINRNQPTRIGTDSDWSTVDAGGRHTMAIKQNGTLWAWGDNLYCQLGDGSLTDKHTPTKVGNDTDWKRVSAGGFHTVATKNDGSYWSWGDNENGQLGNGTTTINPVPVRMSISASGGTPVAGGTHTMIVTPGFALWTMGNDTYGQCGDGSGHTLPPTQIIKACSSPWVLFQSAILSGIAEENN